MDQSVLKSIRFKFLINVSSPDDSVPLYASFKSKIGDVSSGDLGKMTKENEDYRRVIYTDKYQQHVLMNITKEDGGIPEETHDNLTQFIRIEDGYGQAIRGNEVILLFPESYVTIPPRTKHKIIQSGDKPLKLYSIYTPPQHPRGLVVQRRADVSDEEEDED